MNPDTVVQLLQKGLRVTLGATTTLIETLQDSQRREENLTKLKSELSQLTEEWEAKGEITEREARNLVDSLWRQQQTTPPPPSAEASPFTPSAAADSASSGSATPAPEVQQDLQELTAQIAAMRAELERLRQQENS